MGPYLLHLLRVRNGFRWPLFWPRLSTRRARPLRTGGYGHFCRLFAPRCGGQRLETRVSQMKWSVGCPRRHAVKEHWCSRARSAHGRTLRALPAGHHLRHQSGRHSLLGEERSPPLYRHDRERENSREATRSVRTGSSRIRTPWVASSLRIPQALFTKRLVSSALSRLRSLC